MTEFLFINSQVKFQLIFRLSSNIILKFSATVCIEHQAPAESLMWADAILRSFPVTKVHVPCNVWGPL